MSKVIDVVAAIIVEGDKYLIARRKPGKHLAGYWEFPGGKIDEGESPEASLCREILEEFDVDCVVGRFVGESLYDYGDKVVRLLAYFVQVETKVVSSQDHDLIEWVPVEKLAAYRLAPADLPLLEFLDPCHLR